MHKRIEALAGLGQSLWYDNIRRGLIVSGDLAAIVADGVTGMTSNPSIFHKAIAGSDDYDRALADLTAAGKSTDETYEALVIEDIRSAADILRPVYDGTDRRDGFVSLEVSPELAYDTPGTVSEAKRLFAAIDRPNVMIKVPATEEGLPAIRTLVAAGLNINVTLIFSCVVYRRVAEAYIAGAEAFVDSGGDPTAIASVASFFVSRVDTAVDRLLEARLAEGMADVESLAGQAAIANTKIAYAAYQEIFGGDRFASLARRGVRVQRPLWASTSTKNPKYPDTYYVDQLIGPDTVNTVPPETLEAFRDHGVVARTVDEDLAGARQTIARLAEIGIDIEEVTEQLRREGVQAFADAFAKLMANLQQRVTAG